MPDTLAVSQSPYMPDTDTRTTPQRLADAVVRMALWEAILEHASIEKACEELGLCRKSLYLLAEKDDDFAKEFDSARRALLDMQTDRCGEIIESARNEVASLAPGNTNGSAIIAGARLAVDTHIRLAGKLSKVYGDKPEGATNVNVGVAVGVVENEKARERLIDLRQHLLGRMERSVVITDEAKDVPVTALSQ